MNYKYKKGDTMLNVKREEYKDCWITYTQPHGDYRLYDILIMDRTTVLHAVSGRNLKDLTKYARLYIENRHLVETLVRLKNVGLDNGLRFM